jgi:hypothetical protein
MLGCQSAPRAAPGFEVNAPAYLYAHTGARNFDEARAILRARIATDSGVQCSGLWRVLARLIGLLSNRDPAGQRRNNDRNDDFSHELFYRVVRTFPTDSTGKSLSTMHGWQMPARRSSSGPELAAVDKAKRRVHHTLGLT